MQYIATLGEAFTRKKQPVSKEEMEDSDAEEEEPIYSSDVEL